MSGYKYFAFIRKRHKIKYYLRTRFVRKIPKRILSLKRPKWKRLQKMLRKGQRPYKKYFYDLKKKGNRFNEMHVYCKNFKLLKRKFCFNEKLDFWRKKRRYQNRRNRKKRWKKKYVKKENIKKKYKIKQFIKFKRLVNLPCINIRRSFFYKLKYINNACISKKKFIILFLNNMRKILKNYKINKNFKQSEHKKLINFYIQLLKKYNIKKNNITILPKSQKITKKRLQKKVPFKNKKKFNICNNYFQKIKIFKKRIKISFIKRREYNKKRFKLKKYILKWKRKIDIRKIWPTSKKRPFLHEPFLITRGIRVKKQPKKLSRSFRKNRMHEKATKLDFNMISKKGGKDSVVRHLDIAKNRFFYMFYKIDYLLRHFNYCVSQYHAVRRMNLAEVNSLQKKLHPLIYVKKNMLITVESSDYIRRINRKKFFKKWQYFGSYIVHDTYSQAFIIIKTLEDLSIEDLRLLNVKRSYINIHKLK